MVARSEVYEVSTAVLLAPAGDETACGDFYLIERVGSRTFIVVGDVTGKGLAAAPYAAPVKSSLGAHLEDAEDPAALLEELNAELYADPSADRFVTAVVLVIDSALHSAQWAVAGHLPPHRLDTGLPVDGARPARPLGLDARCGATSAEYRPVHPGEGFVLFTDGLEDVRDAAGDRFGTARITHALSNELRGADPERVVHGLKDAACEFGRGELYDDMCIVAIRVD